MDSLALVINRPILELLKIEPDTPLEVTTDGKQLFVAPAKPSSRRTKFEAAQELVHKRYVSLPMGFTHHLPSLLGHVGSSSRQ